MTNKYNDNTEKSMLFHNMERFKIMSTIPLLVSDKEKLDLIFSLLQDLTETSWMVITEMETGDDEITTVIQKGSNDVQFLNRILELLKAYP